MQIENKKKTGITLSALTIAMIGSQLVVTNNVKADEVSINDLSKLPASTTIHHEGYHYKDKYNVDHTVGTTAQIGPDLNEGNLWEGMQIDDSSQAQFTTSYDFLLSYDPVSKKQIFSVNRYDTEMYKIKKNGVGGSALPYETDAKITNIKYNTNNQSIEIDFANGDAVLGHPDGSITICEQYGGVDRRYTGLPDTNKDQFNSSSSTGKINGNSLSQSCITNNNNAPDKNTLIDYNNLTAQNYHVDHQHIGVLNDHSIQPSSNAADATITPDGQIGHDVANPSSVEPPMSNANSAASTSQASSAAPTSQASSADHKDDIKITYRDQNTNKIVGTAWVPEDSDQILNQYAPKGYKVVPVPINYSPDGKSAWTIGRALGRDQQGNTLENVYVEKNDSVTPTSQSSSVMNSGSSSTVSDKVAANIAYNKGVDPLTNKVLKDESPAQQQKAKTYIDALNKGETPEQAKKDVGIITDTEKTSQASDADKNSQIGNTDKSSQTSDADKSSQASDADKNSQVENADKSSQINNADKNSPVRNANETSQISNAKLAQTASNNKVSIGTILGLSSISIMSILSVADILHRRE